MKTVLDPARYPLRPHYIDVDRVQNFVGLFGDSQTETAARIVLRFCSRQFGWEPFSYEVINGFRLNFDGEPFDFHRLTEQGFIVKGADCLYRVTHEFVTASWLASPAIGV